jgi:peptide/nickel transport system ATP-binding protein
MSAMADNTPLLQVRDLDIRFRIDRKSEPFRAVKGISFDIPTNSTVALVGESGSGKSVSAMAILGLLPENAIVAPESQAITAAATCSRPRSPSARRCRGKDISVIFQEPMTSLNPVFTVGRADRRVPAPAHGHDRRARPGARVIELLAEVGIPTRSCASTPTRTRCRAASSSA